MKTTKPLSVVLANGKSGEFANGDELFAWFVKQEKRDTRMFEEELLAHEKKMKLKLKQGV